MIRLFVLLAVIAAFMDPCDKKPRNIELNEVPEACSTATGRMFVRVKGFVQRTPDILCSDYPGGRRCEISIATASGASVLPVLIKGSEKRAGQYRYESTLAAPEGTSKGSIDPYRVKFDEAEITDRNGDIADHINGPVDLSGSLQLDEKTNACSLLVVRVEGGRSSG